MAYTQYFEYRCYEGEDSADAELWHPTHQQVTVLRKLGPEEAEEVGMYHVPFPDGYGYDVFHDELLEGPWDYERPDYMALVEGEA